VLVVSGAPVWPAAELDPVARLRALAASMPWVGFEEAVIAAPFARVWSYIDDMERGVPQFEGNVRRLEIVRREGERLWLLSESPLGVTLSMQAVLRSGWCVMGTGSGSVQIGMAARAEAPGCTRFAHFEGSRWLGRLARPLFRAFVRRDLASLARLAEAGAASHGKGPSPS
jgi:hypothetical protein